MSSPAIARYPSPPSSLCPTHHKSSSYSSGSSSDFNSRRSSTSTSSSPTIRKPVAGGLSCLFSVQSVRHASTASCCTGGDEPGSLWQDRSDELCSSFSYSPYSSAFNGRDQSPVSVFQCPVSCGVISTLAGGSSRSLPLSRIPRAWNDCEMRAGTERLFQKVVRNALESCLDYDSKSFPIGGGGELVMDEFNFNMEESFAGMVVSCEPYAKELLYGAQSRHKIFYEEFVVKAFYEAEKAHRGQMRATGDPYLQHCVETAVLLAGVGANATVVSAGLLHDAVDDSFMTCGDIFRMFGTGVADLVEGVSKLSLLSKLARENNTANKTIEADRLHTMFLAMADARAVLIKLADRLHNMMTLEALPMLKQQRFAKETLEIFVPLANRLGISSWKEQLEDLCFKHLNPQSYREFAYRLIKSSDEAMLASAKEKLEQALNDGGVSYHVLSGRHKNLYSIYSKMLKKKLNMNEIVDIHGLRLIVENEEDCYKALDIVHNLWPKALRKLKDYIMHPKFNGYQSLHTVVLTEDVLPLEVQVRTKEMHLQAEYGFAAHWRYKEGDCKYSSFVEQMVEWARWVLTWQCETMTESQGASLCIADSVRPPCPFPSHSDDCPFSYTTQCDQEEPVFIILLENEKMSVQEFPANSTVMDLMERIGRGSSTCPPPCSFHTKEELRPRLNHEPISSSYQRLKMGDVVELTPTIQDKSLTEHRKEIKRMYDRGLSTSASISRRS